MKLQFAWRLRFFSAGGGVWGMYFRGGAYKFGGFASFIRLLYAPRAKKKGIFLLKNTKWLEGGLKCA